MNFLNPKAQTLKIPRNSAGEFDQEHALDILLACAYFGVNPVSHSEFNCFEHYIANSPDNEISHKIKEAFAELSDNEKEKLFR